MFHETFVLFPVSRLIATITELPPSGSLLPTITPEGVPESMKFTTAPLWNAGCAARIVFNRLIRST